VVKNSHPLSLVVKLYLLILLSLVALFLVQKRPSSKIAGYSLAQPKIGDLIRAIIYQNPEPFLVQPHFQDKGPLLFEMV
jgi:hypothetical protein